MCNFENGFVLCTCANKNKLIVHHKKSKRHAEKQPNEKTVYRWFLYQLEGEISACIMDGIFAFPLSDIGNGLNAAWVLLNLNNRNCFDIEYKPTENDSLIIRKGKITQPEAPYLAFMVKNGIWVEEYDLNLDISSKLFLQGIVNEITNDHES